MAKALFDISDKVAVVTGGTGVLGGAMVRGLAEAGAKVAILGRNLQVGNTLVAALLASGYEASFVQVDVLDEASLSQAKNQIITQYNSIDILVNAVGGNLPGATIAPNKSFFELDHNSFKDVVDLNLIATILPTQVFAATMAEKKQGVIVNISSMAAFRPLTRVVGYAAAKAAVNNFTQWLAVEMCQKFGEGIRVNAIAPGFFLTAQNRTLLINADGSLTDRAQRIIANTPFGRFGKPEELVGTLLWLCSDASSFVSGIVVPVDGGYNAFSGV